MYLNTLHPEMRTNTAKSRASVLLEATRNRKLFFFNLSTVTDSAHRHVMTEVWRIDMRNLSL